VGCKAKQAFTSAVNWVGDHKAEVVGFAVGAVVGIGCGVAIGWTGVGAVACGALAGAAGSAATYLMQTQVEHTSEFSWGGLALNVGVGAITGAIGGALGSIGGAAIKAGAGALFNQGLKAGLSSAVKAAGQEGMDIVTGKVTGGLLSNAAKSAADSAAQDMADAAESCLINSFAAGTAVTMADGMAKEIQDIRPGDQVLATDQQSGTAAPHAVAATVTGVGAKDLVDIHIAGPDSQPTPTVLQPRAGRAVVATGGTLTATVGHPFWVVNRHAWVDAGQLTAGDQVSSLTGERLAVLSVRHYTAYLRVFNLSVSDVHTYYVVAGAVPVLVHNCGGSVPGHPPTCTCAGPVQPGQTVYRVWGEGVQDGASPWGRYWSRVDPRTVGSYRDAAGLPDANPGRFLTVGKLLSTDGVEVTPGGAAPLNGNIGGIDEIKVPNPTIQIEILDILGLNPEF
jgi:hypothetical protein